MAPALVLVPAAFASFILAFGTGVEFVCFTSLQPLLGGSQKLDRDTRQEWLIALQDPRILAALAWDLGLVLLFVGQHSLMAADPVKTWMAQHFGVLQRSLYVACTALALQVVMRYWEPVPEGPVLWEAQSEPWVTWVPLLCFVLHIIAWLLIFSILLVFDYPELMGLKQLKISFNESALETTYQYPSESSVLEELGPEPEAPSTPDPSPSLPDEEDDEEELLLLQRELQGGLQTKALLVDESCRR
ncbi:nurim isoform X3 [Antechinus flavipes]|uniref:nurim isoform X3 n=1 Tax=Antechinus flavipes TaxID=38775 RepID=UPI002235FE30|nr:nurim isoform X3 [Antechinus flavipes]